MTDRNNEAFVYHLLDEDDRVIYVGSSSILPARIAVHRRKVWGDQIASVRFWVMPSAVDAVNRESADIDRLRPIHNVSMNGDASRAASGSHHVDVVACLMSGPKTQREVIREVAEQGGNSECVGITLRRLLGKGHVVVDHMRPTRGSKRRGTRVYALATRTD